MFSSIAIRSSVLCLLVCISNSALSLFYQAETLANYCRQYLDYVEIEANVDKYEAGICAGYIASKIEVMSLSEQLCGKENLNLDFVINEFILEVDDNDELKQESAALVVVKVLQENFACN